jgi:hypothetical protein
MTAGRISDLSRCVKPRKPALPSDAWRSALRRSSCQLDPRVGRPALRRSDCQLAPHSGPASPISGAKAWLRNGGTRTGGCICIRTFRYQGENPRPCQTVIDVVECNHGLPRRKGVRALLKLGDYHRLGGGRWSLLRVKGAQAPHHHVARLFLTLNGPR